MFEGLPKEIHSLSSMGSLDKDFFQRALSNLLAQSQVLVSTLLEGNHNKYIGITYNSLRLGRRQGNTFGF